MDRLSGGRPRVGAVLLVTATILGVSCGDDDGEAPPDAPAQGDMQFNTDGEMNTGDIEVEAPEGWDPIALVDLGFGVAVPPDWEATILTEEALDAVLRATPRVPDFGLTATRAAAAGAVFYAAGLDPEDDSQVNDLKVQADVSSDVEDLEGLETYARETVAGGDPEDVDVSVVEDAPHPTVDVRYRTAGQVAGQEREVTVEGVQRSVLVPDDAASSFVVYSFIVTGESEATADELAPDIFATIAFSPEA